MQMRPLHEAVFHAALACHLFDEGGHLHPFTFPAEIVHTAALHADPGRGHPAAVAALAAALAEPRAGANGHLWPYPRLGDVDGGTAAFGGVPAAAVRGAWARAVPWMRTPLPDWWAFKVRRCALCVPVLSAVRARQGGAGLSTCASGRRHGSRARRFGTTTWRPPPRIVATRSAAGAHWTLTLAPASMCRRPRCVR